MAWRGLGDVVNCGGCCEMIALVLWWGGSDVVSCGDCYEMAVSIVVRW